MNDVQKYVFEGNSVRTLLVDGEPWFVAADVAKILGYRMASDMTRRIDAEDRGTRPVRTPSGEQQMTVISEPGLYLAVLGSQVEGAKAFKQWMTREVLPAIRRTGMYEVKPKTLEERALEIVGELQSVVANQAQELEAARPKVAQIDMYRQAEGLQTISDLANQLKVWALSNAPSVKVLHQDVFDLAGELHIIIRGDTVRRNQATAQAVKSDWVKVKESIIGSGDKERVVFSVRLTHRGAGRLWDAAVARIAAGEPIYGKKAS
ncbi:BRO family protein [Glutamicibacter sp. NPDC087344]|uniref:BRO family protein n=1 Tax=Glutamicibacter sp. NPDC087344 TaxID=3363994 RepID=UPI00382839C6